MIFNLPAKLLLVYHKNKAMKKIIVTLVFFIVATAIPIFGQTTSNDYVKHLNLYFSKTKLLSMTASLSTETSLSSFFNDADSLLVFPSSVQQVQNSEVWITEVYTNALKTDELRLFTASKDARPQFIPYKQGNSIMLPNFISKYVYNSHNMSTTRERAQYATKSMFFSVLYGVLKSDVDLKTQYVGFSFSYSYKDFSEKQYVPNDGVVTIVFPYAELKKLKQYQITEDDFIKQCDFYMLEKGEAVKFNYVIQ